jgi:hypothetical protein
MRPAWDLILSLITRLLPPAARSAREACDASILTRPLQSVNQSAAMLAEWRHGAGLQALWRADAYDLPGGRRVRWLAR